MSDDLHSARGGLATADAAGRPLRRPRRRLLVGCGLALGAGAAGLAASPSSALGLINGLAALPGRRRLDGAAYGTHPRQRYDLFTPGGAPPAAGWPLVVFFYGGAWNSGARADYRFVGEALAARGQVAMVADYRLYPEVRYPDFLHDCAAALGHGLAMAGRWRADRRRVFVMGHSAGAYNAAMLALDPRWLAREGRAPDELAGWIGLAGPYDFLPIRTPAVQPVFHHPQVPPGTQPIGYASTSRLPALLLAARQDDSVNPQRNTAGLAQALSQAGAPVVTRAFDRVNHATLVGAMAWPLRLLAPVLDEVTAFVAATPPASPSTPPAPAA